MTRITPQLMFNGAVTDVVALWSRAFPDMTVTPLMGDGQNPGLMQVTLAGQEMTLFDSPVKHDFTFTPAMSLVVYCDEADEVDRLAGILGEGGAVMMPLDSYDFAPRFTWIADRFGVSWQLMWRPEASPA